MPRALKPTDWFGRHPMFCLAMVGVLLLVTCVI
jgi:hypothetical protein